MSLTSQAKAGQQALESVRQRIEAACVSCGRDPAGIRLAAVSKYHTTDEIRALYEAGQRIFAENKVQELRQKKRELQDELPHIRWHLIGTLQSNKVKYVVGEVELIQSADRISLLQAIEKRAAALGIVQDVLLQVNFAKEETKHGFLAEETAAALREARDYSHLRIRGLMGMGRSDMDSEERLAYFRAFYQFWKDLSLDASLHREPELFDTLSLGMSGDFEQAIAAGANLLRIGTALFGPRPNVPGTA